MLSIMSFWSAMALLCCVIVSLRFAMRHTTLSRLVLLSSRSGETKTLAMGKGGNLFCVDRGAIVRVLSDCCASRTFALGFLVLLAGPGVGGVADTRPRVEAAIGAPALWFVDREASHPT